MDITGLFTVFGISALELWAGIPAGFVMKLNPAAIFGVASAGSIVSALIVIFAGDAVRNMLVKNKNSGSRQGRAAVILEKYGVPGLGLLSPLLFGAPLGAALGVILGVGRAKLALWMTLGILLWAAALTFAGVLGIDFFKGVKS